MRQCGFQADMGRGMQHTGHHERMRFGFPIGWAMNEKTGLQAQDFARLTSSVYQQRPRAVAAIREQVVNHRLIERPAWRRQLEDSLGKDLLLCLQITVSVISAQAFNAILSRERERISLAPMSAVAEEIFRQRGIPEPRPGYPAAARRRSMFRRSCGLSGATALSNESTFSPLRSTRYL